MIFDNNIEQGVSNKILSSLRYHSLSHIYVRYEDNCIYMDADETASVCDIRKPQYDISLLADKLVYNGPVRIDPDAVEYLPGIVSFRGDIVFTMRQAEIKNRIFVMDVPGRCLISHPYNIQDCKFICNTSKPSWHALFQLDSTYACNNVQIEGFTLLDITFDNSLQSLQKILEDGFICGIHFNDDVKCVYTPNHVAIRRRYSSFMNGDQRHLVFTKDPHVNKKVPGAYVFGNFENCIFHITDLDRESTFEAGKCHFENVKIVGFNTVRMEPSRITTFEEFIEGLKHNVVCGAQISEARNIVITQYEMLDGERCKYRFDAMHDSIISKIGVLPKAKHVGHWWVTEIR